MGGRAIYGEDVQALRNMMEDESWTVAPQAGTIRNVNLFAPYRDRIASDVKLARLMIFGALNWSVQWFDRRGAATLDDLADAALALFLSEAP